MGFILIILTNFLFSLIKDYPAKYHIENNKMTYCDFIRFIEDKMIDKLIIRLNRFKINSFTEDGLLFIKIIMKDKQIKYLSVIDYNSFILNLEDYQKNNLEFEEKDFVKVEFERPYNGI